MRTLKINKNALKLDKRVIGKYSATIKGIDEKEIITVEIKCDNIHNLPKNGTVMLILNEGEYIKEYDYETLSSFVFNVYIPKYVMMHVTNYANTTNNAVLEPVNDYFTNYVSDIKNITVRNNGEEIKGFINIVYDENGIPTNEEDAAARIVLCDKPIGFSGRGFIEVLNDWFLKDGKFNEDIVFKENFIAIEVGIPMERDTEYRLSDSQNFLNEYLQHIKDSIIPEIVNNEKQRFVPIYYDERGESKYVKEIVFNLHFRDRKDTILNDGSLRDGWKTTDEQLWNGMSLKNGKLRYDINGIDDGYSDTLNHLGFTEDDIKFSKNRLKKSFIRMTYFPSNDMMRKEAITYATVFLDSGELYEKYIKISGKHLSIFDDKRLDKDLRLSATFKICNNRQNRKSSEGFYLYLYPDIINNENSQKTIYMKIEFNHAGFGKTVPMMSPRNRNGNIIKSQDNDFPLNFTPEIYDNEGNVGQDFDFKAYQNAILIPINIGYDAKFNEYVYSFPFVPCKNGQIELNLFEPRINGNVL